MRLGGGSGKWCSMRLGGGSGGRYSMRLGRRGRGHSVVVRMRDVGSLNPSIFLASCNECRMPMSRNESAREDLLSHCFTYTDEPSAV